MGDEVRWTLVRGDHEWHSCVLGTTYPGSSLDVDVEILDLDGTEGTAAGWVALRRGRLAISVGRTQEVAEPDWKTGRQAVWMPAEEHHADWPAGVPETVGVVLRIRSVRCHVAPEAPGNKVLRPVQGTATLTDMLRVPAGAVEPSDGVDDQGSALARQFVGYLVDLEVAEARDGGLQPATT
ncbi:MAG TPA: DUF6578 domain-containing protein [Actinomycetes bacterium]